MEKVSKVKTVNQNARSYDSKFGKMFVHELAMENGDIGEYSSKTETCKFKVGEEMTYTIETNGTFPDKIKPVQKNNNFGGGGNAGGNRYEPKNQEVITALSCLSSASTLYSLQKDSTPEKVIAAAEQFYAFAMGKSKIVETPKS